MSVDEYGRLDYAFNNAGIVSEQVPVPDSDYEHWREVVDVNLVKVFYCMRADLRRMQAQDGGGVVVNKASVCRHLGDLSCHFRGRDVNLLVSEGKRIDTLSTSMTRREVR